ncbi:MAG TPA: tannase/feruloyl esterase family alpha/beta hydrolase [Candidatus Sulfopaludibacter sp.]|jgi:feruloyl esterase|nr:tannase/feruloyl esterase family alpha/beta hydrolase [Candidatus Sulfopaludibacter sp.]
MSRLSMLLLALSAAPLAAAPCESLAELKLPHTVIRVAHVVPAGAYTPAEGRPIPNLPAFCRVAGTLKPSDDSDIEFEVWMPSTGWNGRFQGVGNGGFAGSLSLSGLAQELRRGYAVATTDTGHNTPGATWALGHHEKVVDFGYRAIHETTVAAKTIVAAFYGEPAQHSYFNSCSNGGRQALMEAQKYPADYDGIIAGAPANYWTHLLVGGSELAQIVAANPASFIPPAKFPAIEAATLAACDATDGLKDGLISDPQKCHFDPSTLLCKGEDGDHCLTAPQVSFLQKVYAGPRTAKGESLYYGYSPGGEGGGGGWVGWITGAAPEKSQGYGFSTQFFSQMVYEDKDWDFRKFDAERDAKAADAKLASILNSTNPDLKAFKDRGGKLILYHGWSDAAIPPVNAIHYYDAVVSKMGSSDAASFTRLYMVPGMQHCGGGPGPNYFWSTNPTARGDAEHDMEEALEVWVEKGAAPGPIVATRFKTGVNPGGGVERTRPLCPYPQEAHWNGKGSSDDAFNFTCR